MSTPRPPQRQAYGRLFYIPNPEGNLAATVRAKGAPWREPGAGAAQVDVRALAPAIPFSSDGRGPVPAANLTLTFQSRIVPRR
jgi:hypothetical protein